MEEKICIEFTGKEFDMIQKYAELMNAGTVQAAVMNAISIALDEADS